MHKKYFYIRLLGLLFSAGALGMEDDTFVNYFDSDPLPIGYGFGPDHAYNLRFEPGLQQGSLRGEGKNNQSLAQASVEVNSLPREVSSSGVGFTKNIGCVVGQQSPKRESSSSMPLAKKARRPRADDSDGDSSASFTDELESPSQCYLIKCMYSNCDHVVEVQDKTAICRSLLSHMCGEAHDKEGYHEYPINNDSSLTVSRGYASMLCPIKVNCQSKISGNGIGELRKNLVRHFYTKKHDPKGYSLVNAYVCKNFPNMVNLKDKKHRDKDIQQIVSQYEKHRKNKKHPAFG